MADFNIIVIDDDVNDSWVTDMKANYPEAVVKCFSKPDDAWAYIDENMVYKTIVFLDCYYNKKMLGVSALKKIREKSSLIAVVMMSAQTVNQMEEQELIDMINEKSVYYSKRPAIEDDYKSIISEIRNSWATSFDCMLEEWLLSSKNEETVVYHSNGRDYTVKQVLEEVRKQSKDGKTLQAAMNLYTINALQNSKIE